MGGGSNYHSVAVSFVLFVKWLGKKRLKKKINVIFLEHRCLFSVSTFVLAVENLNFETEEKATKQILNAVAVF